jgi:predicted dehydrogenase
MTESVKSKQRCRWGMMSTATIARKNWLAIKNSGNGVVVAVSSRKRETAESFIDQCQSTEPIEARPRAVEGYDALLQQNDIDAIYIPLPTGLRKQWVIRAAEAGKHVLCEKPCAINTEDLLEMTEACQSNGVQFMDGVMFMHTQRMVEMRAVLDDSSRFGEVRRIACQFSFRGGDEFQLGNIRTNSQLEPLGALGDLGWYTVRFALWAMKYQMPVRVIGRMLQGFQRSDSPHSVPLEISGELLFENGVSATFFNSFLAENQQWASVSGTHGHLHLSDFVLPYAGDRTKFYVTHSEFVVDGCRFQMKQNENACFCEEPADSEIDSQESKLYRKFAEIVISGQAEPHWPEISLMTQRVLDAVMQSALNDGQPVEL